MASFPLKCTYFHPFNPKFKTVRSACTKIAEILHARVKGTWLFIRVESFFSDLMLSHNTSVTDDGWTDDNRTNSSTIT